MLNDIKYQIKKTGVYFVVSLNKIMRKMYTPNQFLEFMVDTNHYYKQFLNYIKIYEQRNSLPKIKLKIMNISENLKDLKVYGYNNDNDVFTVIFHIKYGIIGISTMFRELDAEAMRFIANVPIESQIEQIEIFLSLYYDYKWRVCDLCLSYLSIPHYLPPLIRTIQQNYVSARHKCCDEIKCELDFYSDPEIRMPDGV
ncbi:hypothetical protein CWI37_0379p0010 [Hamiltosporidium tvaerminnensis]|uniref:Uncharacterized protein n=3 Tax=Hamiltosporidium TaxID=1176354 RepID=A0A4Q9L8D0_9MICR|nr:hypothetical protein CWI37_1568p0010 [Hamiltosporidium tvaerminnensis]TBU02980.1 hypothetical protein CWI37_0379p0010 [Hamiltosporidium tvaerminnensis]TBU03215.1 hypothetical protein CWI39_1006p0010 [Hamiltosporidium magnivora]